MNRERDEPGPPTRGLSGRDRAWRVPWVGVSPHNGLSSDVAAGLTLAAYAIPVSLAYATLAGLPPQTGLYCYLVGGLAYALLGSSRHLAIGPTSAIALLLGVSLAGLGAGDAATRVALASLTAIVTAGIFFVAWLFRLSVLVNFISESILTGFKAGAALVIASTQLPKLLGVAGGGDDFLQRIGLLTQQLGATHGLTLAIGCIALAALVCGDRWLPRWPVALGVVLVSLLVVWLGGLDGHGVRTVGLIPAGLPSLAWPDMMLPPSQARQLMRLAAACFLLSYVESISAARTFAFKHRYDIDPRRELLALGGATLLAGLFQGFPLAGGLSQTAVNERGGARSPLSLVVASLMIGCVLVFLTGLFQTLPEAVLAAIVLLAVGGLIDVAELVHLWRVSRLDFGAAAIALAGVLLMGVLDGVLIAVLASVVMLLAQSARPHVAFLGRIPGTDRFGDVARHPDNEPLPGILAFRVEASLLYFNVDHVLQTVRKRIAGERGLRMVVCDLSNVPYLDIAGARLLRRLHDELAPAGISFRIVEAHGRQRELLRAEGLEERVGGISRNTTLSKIVASGE